MPAMRGDLGSIPGLGRSPGGLQGNPLQYSWMENPMDRGAWWATVHGGPKKSDMAEQLSTAQHREERGQNMCIPSTEKEFSCSELSTKVLSFSVSFTFPSP